MDTNLTHTIPLWSLVTRALKLRAIRLDGACAAQSSAARMCLKYISCLEGMWRCATQLYTSHGLANVGAMALGRQSALPYQTSGEHMCHRIEPIAQSSVAVSLHFVLANKMPARLRFVPESIILQTPKSESYICFLYKMSENITCPSATRCHSSLSYQCLLPPRLPSTGRPVEGI